MKIITGKINGIDVQTTAKRTQAFVVETPRQMPDIQVTTYDDEYQIRLAIASLFNIEVTVEYDETGGEHIVQSLYAKEMERLAFAKEIARLKNVETEDTVENDQLIRVRILDR